MAKGLWINSDKSYAINTDMIIAIHYKQSSAMRAEHVDILILDETKIVLEGKSMNEFLEFVGMGKGGRSEWLKSM